VVSDYSSAFLHIFLLNIYEESLVMQLKQAGNTPLDFFNRNIRLLKKKLTLRERLHLSECPNKRRRKLKMKKLRFSKTFYSNFLK